MRRIVILSSLLLTLASCSDGANSPTAVAAPQPTPPPVPPSLSTVLLGGTWTGTTVVTGYSPVNYTAGSQGFRCLEARLSLEQGLVRTVEASFAPDRTDFIRGTFQLEPDWTLSGDFRDSARSNFSIWPLFLRNSSTRQVCSEDRAYATQVWIGELRVTVQGDTSPPNRLTGELYIRYRTEWNDQVSFGYFVQTNSITLSR